MNPLISLTSGFHRKVMIITKGWRGQPAVVTPGMKGKVISLHDGFHLDVAEVEPIPPKAIVQFDSGITLMVDERMRWEKADDPS